MAALTLPLQLQADLGLTDDGQHRKAREVFDHSNSQVQASGTLGALRQAIALSPADMAGSQRQQFQNTNAATVPERNRSQRNEKICAEFRRFEEDCAGYRNLGEGPDLSGLVQIGAFVMTAVLAVITIAVAFSIGPLFAIFPGVPAALSLAFSIWISLRNAIKHRCLMHPPSYVDPPICNGGRVQSGPL